MNSQAESSRFDAAPSGGHDRDAGLDEKKPSFFGGNYDLGRSRLRFVDSLLYSMDRILMYVMAGMFGVGLGTAALRRPILLAYIAILISAGSTLLREFDSGVQEQSTYSGLSWVVLTLLILVALVVGVRRIRVPWFLWGFVALSLWAATRWVSFPTGFRGLKDVLWYSLPVVFGLFVPVMLSARPSAAAGGVRALERAFLFSSLIPIGLLVFTVSTGLAKMTWRGPVGAFIGDSRSLTLYLLVVMIVALANWRYGPLRLQGRFFSVLIAATILLTLARMAGFLAVLVVLLHRINPRRGWQVVAVGIAVLSMTAYVAFNVDFVKKRFFVTGSWSEYHGVAGINTAGRGSIWPAVFESAKGAPIIGKGLGEARLVGGLLYIDLLEHQTQNEYLQLFHDMGVIGLLIGLVAWLGTLWYVWRAWSFGESDEVKKWGMIGSLGIGVVLVSSLTDNTLHYPHVLAPVMIAIGISAYLGREIREDSEGPADG